MPSTKAYRRSPRLKDFDYFGPLTAHLILVTRGREPLFLQPEMAKIALTDLNTISSRFGVTVHAYCFMPDHVHLLIEVPEQTSMKEFVRIYKQTSGFAIKQETWREAWQVSYYDRVLRKEEALEDVANYIWNNPVEDGLVSDRLGYELSGPRELMV